MLIHLDCSRVPYVSTRVRPHNSNSEKLRVYDEFGARDARSSVGPSAGHANVGALGSNAQSTAATRVCTKLVDASERHPQPKRQYCYQSIVHLPVKTRGDER